MVNGDNIHDAHTEGVPNQLELKTFKLEKSNGAVTRVLQRLDLLPIAQAGYLGPEEKRFALL